MSKSTQNEFSVTKLLSLFDLAQNPQLKANAENKMLELVGLEFGVDLKDSSISVKEGETKGLKRLVKFLERMEDLKLLDKDLEQFLSKKVFARLQNVTLAVIGAADQVDVVESKSSAGEFLANALKSSDTDSEDLQNLREISLTLNEESEVTNFRSSYFMTLRSYETSSEQDQRIILESLFFGAKEQFKKDSDLSGCADFLNMLLQLEFIDFSKSENQELFKRFSDFLLSEAVKFHNANFTPFTGTITHPVQLEQLMRVYSQVLDSSQIENKAEKQIAAKKFNQLITFHKIILRDFELQKTLKHDVEEISVFEAMQEYAGYSGKAQDLLKENEGAKYDDFKEILPDLIDLSCLEGSSGNFVFLMDSLIWMTRSRENPDFIGVNPEEKFIILSLYQFFDQLQEKGELLFQFQAIQDTISELQYYEEQGEVENDNYKVAVENLKTAFFEINKILKGENFKEVLGKSNEDGVKKFVGNLTTYIDQGLQNFEKCLSLLTSKADEDLRQEDKPKEQTKPKKKSKKKPTSKKQPTEETKVTDENEQKEADRFINVFVTLKLYEDISAKSKLPERLEKEEDIREKLADFMLDKYLLKEEANKKMDQIFANKIFEGCSVETKENIKKDVLHRYDRLLSEFSKEFDFEGERGLAKAFHDFVERNRTSSVPSKTKGSSLANPTRLAIIEVG